MGEMKYIKLFYDKVELCRQMGLSDEEFGSLIYAVVEYCQTGTKKKNIPDRIKYPYFDMISGADRAKTDYEKKCATNAANGAKGGKTKAENAKKAAGNKNKSDQSEEEEPEETEGPRKIISYKDFKEVAEEAKGNYCEFTEKKLKEFYEFLKETDFILWGFDFLKDPNLEDLKELISMKFDTYFFDGYVYEILDYIADEKGYKCAIDTLYKILSPDHEHIITIDNETGSMYVQGKFFSFSQWSDGIDYYFNQQKVEPAAPVPTPQNKDRISKEEALKEVYSEMDKAGISEEQILELCSTKDYFSKETSIADYPDDFIINVLFGSWTQVKEYIQNHSER